jgi:UDP-glucuronate decarboxylase
MRVLVAGGSGFLGSHMCEFLLDEGHEVLAVDNFFTGNRENIVALLESKRFELLRHDVTFPLFVEVDAILNLACPASPKQYQSNPVQTMKTNVMGAINLLGLAKRADAIILQASTSEVYGDPVMSPQKEDYWGNVNPVGIRSCYDEGKRAAETLFSDYNRQYKVKTKIARIFNTYGPKMALDDGRVVSNFIIQALQNKPITMYGDGSQTRSFCYVSDLIRGLYSLLLSDQSVVYPINIGNPNEFTILELATKIKSLTNSKSEIIFEKLPSDDPRQRKPDIEKARRILEWEPSIELEEGLLKSIPYFENKLANSLSKN